MNRNDMNMMGSSASAGWQNEAPLRLVPSEDERWHYHPQGRHCNQLQAFDSTDNGLIRASNESDAILLSPSSKRYLQPSLVSLHDLMATMEPRSNVLIPPSKKSKPSAEQN